MMNEKRTIKAEPALQFQESMQWLIDMLVAGKTEAQANSMKRTPERFLKAMFEQTAGYNDDPAEILKTTFEEPSDEMIVVSDIDFNSVCEHHLLPFIGQAVVGYIPSNGSVVGLSKIPRLVDCYSRRLQMQERLTVQIADALERYLKPRGIGVILTAHHQCMSCRGVKKQNAKMHTSVLRGFMKDDDKARAEFMRFK